MQFETKNARDVPDTCFSSPGGVRRPNGQDIEEHHYYNRTCPVRFDTENARDCSTMFFSPRGVLQRPGGQEIAGAEELRGASLQPNMLCLLCNRKRVRFFKSGILESGRGFAEARWPRDRGSGGTRRSNVHANVLVFSKVRRADRSWWYFQSLGLAQNK